jgi:hypothetical protein
MDQLVSQQPPETPYPRMIRMMNMHFQLIPLQYMDMFQLCHESGPFPPQGYAPKLLVYENSGHSPPRMSPEYPPYRLYPLAPCFFNVFGVSITSRRYPCELEEKILKALCGCKQMHIRSLYKARFSTILLMMKRKRPH